MFIQLSKIKLINVDRINFIYKNYANGLMILNYGDGEAEISLTDKEYDYVLTWLPDLKIMEAK